MSHVPPGDDAKQAATPASQSVVRRSLLVMVFHLAGHALNYIMFHAASRMVDPTVFGVFYTANTAINLLLAPISAFCYVLGVHFAAAYKAAGRPAVAASLRASLKPILRGGAVGAALLWLALIELGRWIGVDNDRIITMVVLTTGAVFVADVPRAALQGSLRFTALGLHWVGWMALRLALVLAALWLTGAAWVGLGAMLVAAAAAAAVGVRLCGAEPRSSGAETALPTLRGAVPVGVAQGAMLLLCNIDLLFVYAFRRDEIGLYAGSALLPKAALVALLPVIQVLIPVLMVGGKSSSPRFGSSLVRAAGLTVALSLMAALAVWLASPLLCGGRFGIGTCRQDVMLPLLLAVVPVALVRVVTLAEAVSGSRWAWLVALALASSAALVALGPADSVAVARAYAEVSAGCVAVFAAGVALTRRLRRPERGEV